MRLQSHFILTTLSLFVLSGMPGAPVWAATVTLNTIKDNSVSAFDGNLVDNSTELDATTSDMSYIMFDINAIAVAESVPANQVVLNSVAFHIIDWRTNRSGTNILYMADVSGGWDEATFNWNEAVANYGAVGGIGTADIDASKRLWEGRLDFTALNVIVDVTATSFAPHTDASLLSAIQADVSSGDGQVVFVMRGQSGTNHYAAHRENDEGQPPARLVIEYSVIPEPSTLMLLGIGALGVRRRRRR
ncbi:MAG: PEP-CTERM sorting domain-containing protein [Pirellulales bacterium]